MSDYIVETTCGRVCGREADGVVNWLGIPYAEPPVGTLRFKRAVPKEPWEGVRDCFHYGSESVQLNEGRELGLEDCLTVNVQRPADSDAEARLPVFVWIHGGGYNTGSACDPLYNGACFARDGLVFASIQYRLNVLGFYDFTTFPGCEGFESNCGLSDQILALKWIHENIAAFGGDPDRVTIAGESAGGASVVNMLAVPSVRGYFQQAIAQSGLPNCVMTHRTARENIQLFLDGMNWTEADLPKLRTIPPYELLEGNEHVQKRHQYRNPGMFLPGPVQDDLLPARPLDAICGGIAAGVKLIIGSNRHEGTMFVHPENTGFPNSWDMIGEMLEKNRHGDALGEIRRYYTGDDAFVRFATDYAFEMPAVKAAMGQRQHTPDVWMYRYELVTKSGEETGMRASHAFELPAVFANRDHPFSRFVFDGEQDEVFDGISREMHSAWVRFAKTGDPGWDRFEGADSPVRIYDRETRTERLDRGGLMELWGDMRFYED